LKKWSRRQEQGVKAAQFPAFLSSPLKIGQDPRLYGRGYTIFETLSPAIAAEGATRAGTFFGGQNSPAGLCGDDLPDGQFVLKTAIELPRTEETKQA
jgi:hypothetical protein